MNVEAGEPSPLKEISFRNRLPVVVQAMIAGVLVAFAGTVPWAYLVSLNIKYGTSFPWAVFITAPYLWLFWKYLRGEGYPRSTSEARRNLLRANNPSGDVWGLAIFSGILGFATLMMLLSIANRMVHLPQGHSEDLSRIPLWTIYPSLLMGSVVAGIVEEAAFRGYMQVPIERRHGPIIAILFQAILFGAGHFSHPEVSLILMPYFIAVGVIYGTMAYFSNSILPGLVLHAGGDFLGFIRQLTQGIEEWQTTSGSQSLIWQTGTDTSFWFSCIGALVMGIATVWMYRSLASAAGKR